MAWKEQKLGPFVLKDRQLVLKDRQLGRTKPALKWFEDMLGYLLDLDERTPFYLGDLWNLVKEQYPETHAQIVDASRLQEKTLDNYAWVATSIPPTARKFAKTVGFAHHQSVAALLPKDRDELLQQAADEKMTLSEIRQAKRRLLRGRVSTGAGELTGTYRVIYADPPWAFDDQGRMPSGARSTTHDHYDNMDIGQLCAVPVDAHVRKNAVLFLWVPVPILLQSPGPREVLESWGFTYKTKIVWSKGRHNLGHYVSNRHEDLLICTRGSCVPDRLTPMIENVQVIPATASHSAKPEFFREIIERLYDGPYLELFARHEAEGWTTWGDQLGVEVAA